MIEHTGCKPFEEDPLPCACQILDQNTDQFETFIFRNDPSMKWIVISIITVFYATSFVYFWVSREEIAFKTRSPKLIALGIGFLYCDSIGNTMIFSG